MSGNRARTGSASREVSRWEAGDGHLGALETDRPGQDGQGNPNIPALDENGEPRDWKKICEDVIGANVDGSQG